MLTYLLFKFESFDTDAMIRALRAFDENGVIVTWDYAGVIRVAHAPRELKLRREYRYFRAGHWTANPWIKWPLNLVLLSWILFRVVSQRRVRRCYIAGGDVLSWVAQLWKFCGRIEQTITSVEDWSLPRPQDTMRDRINKFKIRLNDRLLTWMDTTVVVFPHEIFAARNEYWRGKTARNSLLLDNQWAWFLEQKRAVATHGKTIAYLGTCRRNFGLEILFDLLPELNREHGFRLKMMGPEDELYRYYQSVARERGVDTLIEWRGFVETADLDSALKDCFCGVNLQELAVNNSRFAINGRILHFLQHLLVPVVTPSSGGLVSLIQQRAMGVVCEPHAAAIREALLKAHHDHVSYVGEIEKFFAENPYRVSPAQLLRL